MVEENEQIHALFASVENYIASAHIAISEGRYLDLTALGPMVDDLCQQVLALPRSAGAEYADPLDVLLASLTDLKAQMQEAQKAISAEAKALQNRAKALKLYGGNSSNENGDA